MFELLTRSTRSRKSLARRTTTLCLERLEDRFSPSLVVSDSLTLGVTYPQANQATFSGQLTSPSGPIANATITLSGAANATTTTNSQGNYSITLSVPQLGTEYAASSDPQAIAAPCVMDNIPPTITSFTAVAEGNGLWLLSGTVVGGPTEGEVVNFGGITPLQGQSTTVNSDGTFDFYAIIPSGEGGWASAQAVDCWGQTSQIAVTYAGT
jgi:hypothetical protein